MLHRVFGESIGIGTPTGKPHAQSFTSGPVHSTYSRTTDIIQGQAARHKGDDRVKCNININFFLFPVEPAAQRFACRYSLIHREKNQGSQ